MVEVTQVKQRSVDRMQVNIEHLDTLLGLAGEVIITSANLHDLERRIAEAINNSKLLTADSLEVVKTSNESARRISQDLHELVMAIRLVPIEDTLRVFRRPVRDLCRTLGRDVELVTESNDTLIDKALAERLVDPLLHILRNAIDHGIEAPLERDRSGKSAGGCVRIAATDTEHDSIITISDNGRGVDEQAVRELAAEKGYQVTPTEPSLLELLCLPGISTAKEVTSTSGRGVGLDLVREVMEEYNGVVELATELGKGTTFTLTIPKLRAVNIVDALTLRAGDRLFALPIDQVVASLGVDPSTLETAMNRSQYIIHQEQVIVVYDLQELVDDVPLNEDRDPLPIVVVKGKAGTIALVISEFIGPQKLVTIPFDEDLQHARGVSGTAVFTGGRLGITLDVDELVAAAVGIEEAPPHMVHEIETVDLRARDTEASVSPDPGTGAQEDSGSTVTDSSNLFEEDLVDLAEELRTGLVDLQDSLLVLEVTPDDMDQLNEAFRRLHSAKGGLTMLGANGPADLAHDMETILDYVRSDKLVMTPENMDSLLDGVAYLTEVAKAMPGSATPPDAELLEKIRLIKGQDANRAEAVKAGDLIGRAFDLSPTVEMQVVSTLKRGEHTYETYLTFDSGRQADFLVAYLILRRIGKQGTVLATLPPVAEIEQGKCGNAMKVLWSTALDEQGVQDFLSRLADWYGMGEFNSLPATIFSYKK